MDPANKVCCRWVYSGISWKPGAQGEPAWVFQEEIFVLLKAIWIVPNKPRQEGFYLRYFLVAKNETIYSPLWIWVGYGLSQDTHAHTGFSFVADGKNSMLTPWHNIAFLGLTLYLVTYSTHLSVETGDAFRSAVAHLVKAWKKSVAVMCACTWLQESCDNWCQPIWLWWCLDGRTVNGVLSRHLSYADNNYLELLAVFLIWKTLSYVTSGASCAGENGQ